MRSAGQPGTGSAAGRRRVVNYPQIVSTLSMANERSLVEQIVARLKVGSEVATVYQGDEGIFAWTVSDRNGDRPPCRGASCAVP